MGARNSQIIQCPTCFAKNIPHKAFPSTRVADYARNRYLRFFRCAPPEKDAPHVEHEWQVNDVRPGTNIRYPELGDDCFSDLTKFGRPEIHKVAKEEE